MELISSLNDYLVEDKILKLRIGIGAGEVGGIHIGGGKLNARYEYFLSGPVLDQIASCEKQASPAEVYVSALAWLLVDKDRLVGVQKGKGLANYLLEAVIYPADLPPENSFPLFQDMEETLIKYIPAPARKELTSGNFGFLGELRTCSILFFHLSRPFKPSNLAELQETVNTIQDGIVRYEGVLRQFMIDDKGSVLIACFGLPYFSHLDDPLRAVLSAVSIHQNLREKHIPCGIGITTGRCFCGNVGTLKRRFFFKTNI